MLFHPQGAEDAGEDAEEEEEAEDMLGVKRGGGWRGLRLRGFGFRV